MKICAVMLALLMSVAVSAAEYTPTQGEIDGAFKEIQEQALDALEPAKISDSCLTIELRAGFKNPDLPFGWCRETADKQTYTVPIP